MKASILKTTAVFVVISAIAACSPAVGSKEWCENLKEKDKSQWTGQEAADFAKNCILPN